MMLPSHQGINNTADSMLKKVPSKKGTEFNLSKLFKLIYLAAGSHKKSKSYISSAVDIYHQHQLNQ